MSAASRYGRIHARHLHEESQRTIDPELGAHGEPAIRQKHRRLCLPPVVQV